MGGDRHIWHEFKHIFDHEMLGYIDGLKMCINLVDQSCDYPYNNDSTYAHGFDRAMELFNYPEIARPIHDALVDKILADWDALPGYERMRLTRQQTETYRRSVSNRLRTLW